MNLSQSACGLAIIFMLAAAPAAFPGTVAIPGAAGGAFSVHVTSIKEARFRSTINQEYDFSCGSAALATLLSYHYDDHVTEPEVFKAMYDSGNKEKIRAQGFSLLDMKKYLEAHGYKAAGYRASLEKLAAVGVPAIVLVTVKGYKHFVVVKGVSGKEVLLGDPAMGTRTVSRDEFNSMWNGLMFLIRNRKEVAMNHFNMESEWRTRVKAPLGTALQNSELSDITTFLR